MTNRLADETSAYLLQHSENPVDWHAWGEEALARARRENRPLLVSIGYSSCHWCHVMERESFEDPETAQLMNERLVCIKVDREERPDLDQIYMEAVMRLTGHGGWPLNVFCTPAGRPFFGGTYFPPERAHGRPSWREVVLAVSTLYQDRPAQAEAQAEQILEGRRASRLGDPAQPVPSDMLRDLCRELMASADHDHGGFGDAPKFPTPTNLEAILLASEYRLAPAGALDHVVFTLRRMARGGLYDQLGGGFHRYSTDALWRVPHFEKMLYDQGQLLRVYAEAFRQTRDSELSWPVEETVGYLERELRSSEGGFCASQDADSEGEEGRFYVWNRTEIEAVLGPDAGPAFCDAYGVTAGGSFEMSGSSVVEHALAGERPRFAEERRKLFEARQSRVAPETDAKHVTAWIAYAMGGLATAGAAFDRAEWVQAAGRTADFALSRMIGDDGRLFRIWDGEHVRVPAFLDDHAALLCGLLDLLRAGGDPRFGTIALQLADELRRHFFDETAGEVFFSAADESLVVRPTSDSDGATPAAAGLAALGLVRLAALTGRPDLRELAELILRSQAPLAARAPIAVPTMVRAAALLEREPGLALILGEAEDPAAQALACRARQLLSSEDAVVVARPDDLPAWLSPDWYEGRTATAGAATAYLCRGRVCSLPAKDADALEAPPGW